MKYIHGVLVASLIIITPLFARAATGLSVSEIMYDAPGTDAGHEWVEFFNSGTSALTIVGGSGSGSFRFNDGASHYVAEAAASGSLTISPGGYAVFADDAAKFLADYPGYSGTLIDTTVSLPNTGGAVKLLDGDGNTLASSSYSSSLGAGGDGNSLQLSGGKWIAALPTPGSANAASAAPAGESQSSSVSAAASSVSSTTAAPPAVKQKQMSATISTPITATAGIPIAIEPHVQEVSDEPRAWGNFHIVFGDGTDVTENAPKAVKHTYAYPGSYVVKLEYNANLYIFDTPDLVARSVITVTAPGVAIATVLPNGTIELLNSGSDEADLSGWILQAAQPSGSFTIPKGTILLQGGTLMLGTMTTKFLPADTRAVSLMLPSGEIVSQTAQAPSIVTDAGALVPQVQASVATAALSSAQQIEEADPPESIPATDQPTLAASVIAAQPAPPDANKKENSLGLFFLGLAGVLVAGFIALKYFGVFGPTSKKHGADDDAMSDTVKIAEKIKIIEE